MSRLEAQLLQETTPASELTDWQEAPAEHHPACPNCGTPCRHEANEPERRKAQEAKISACIAAMEPVLPVEWGFFPLDEQLVLASGSLTPTAEEHLVHL